MLANTWEGRPIVVDLESFEQSLTTSKIVSDVDIFDVRSQSESTPETAEELADILIRRKKLTPFQARQVLAGHSDALVLGEHVLVDEIGQGGMGRVFLARHCAMDRLVAIKVLNSSNTDPKVAKRFEREVRAAARLQHPNIVTAYNAFLGDGQQFLVMEYVDGRNLEETVRESGPLSIDDAMDVLRQAAAGLQCAHENGVCHRDIKPANLLIDARGSVKLLDLGLARLEMNRGAKGEIEPTVDQGLTQHGQVMGTVAYMSPEQARDTQAADERSDIYSLGGVFHFLLTGRPLFESESVVNSLMALANERPPTLCDSRGDVPEAVESIYAKMVKKSPADRYQDVGQLIDDLDRYCDENQSDTHRNLKAATELNLPASGEDAPTAPAKDKPRSRSIIAVAAAAMVLAGCAVAFVVANWGDDPADTGPAAESTGSSGAAAQLSDRELAHWVLGLSRRCWVTFTSGGRLVHVTTAEQVDKLSDAAVLTGVGIRNADPWDAAHMDRLRQMTQLTSVSFYGTAVDDDQVPVLVDCPNIVMLQLERTNISDHGLALLGEATRLRDVAVGQNDLITNNGLRHLANLVGLERLSVRQTKISDEGLKSLHGLKNLTYLNVQGTNVTREGIENFSSQLPVCKIDLGEES
ncbi:MAG: protein kinase [Pirellulaceae bacterium]|nr:protein kinase [Pirellulaceae bacterium]MDP7018912.1 protein kinase [Pirellulaceae bacterium]